MTQIKKPSSVPKNLPSQLTPFVGRESELLEVTKLLLDPSCQLLNIVGPGGIGKTRLASQIVLHFGNEFVDGIYFVPLQLLSSLNLIASEIADSMDLSFSGTESPEIQLLDHLKNKNILLVLDNYDHLTENVSLMTTILEVAPSVKILVTSRETLNLQNEWIFSLKGLPFPTDRNDSEYEKYGSVQLFAERAQRMNMDFSLENESKDVIRICQLVEGLPLAIEIAAAWNKTLSCADIAEQIETNIEFLVTNLRDVPERHQSFQAVFYQSWEMLTSKEQDAYQKLSVFSGSFDYLAAQHIASATLPILSSLVSKSLIERDPEGRYKFHELLRQQVQEILSKSNHDMNSFRNAHCKYYAEFLNSRRSEFYSKQHKKIYAEIEKELDNLRSAWVWALNNKLIEEIFPLEQALIAYYSLRGLYQEGKNALVMAIRALQTENLSDNVSAALALLKNELAWHYIRIGELKNVEAVLGQSQELYDKLNIPFPPGQGTDPAITYGILALINGNYEKAMSFGEKAYQSSIAQDHKSNLTLSLYLLTSAATGLGNIDQAQKFGQQSCLASEEANDLWFKAYCLIELGNAYRVSGDYLEAKLYYQESYDIREEFEDREGMALALIHLGEISIHEKNYPEAKNQFQQSLQYYQKITDKGGLATAFSGLGKAAFGMKDYDDARRYFTKALTIARGLRFIPLIFSLLCNISELLFLEGNEIRSVELLSFTLNHTSLDHEAQEIAEKLIAQYKNKLPQTEFNQAQARGKAADFDTLLFSLQAELTAHLETPDQKSSGLNQPLIDPLTTRELEVLQLIANGLTNQQIAEQLIISTGTAKWYTSQIYQKLNVKSRTQAVAYGRELEIIT